jgi:hypothetical protein
LIAAAPEANGTEPPRANSENATCGGTAWSTQAVNDLCMRAVLSLL